MDSGSQFSVRPFHGAFLRIVAPEKLRSQSSWESLEDNPTKNVPNLGVDGGLWPGDDAALTLGNEEPGRDPDSDATLC